MARVRRYWIRYNKGADRLEQEITIGVLRPNGPGWVEVDIDHCCNLIESCSEQVIEATIEEVEVDETCIFTLTIDGLVIGEGVLMDAGSTVQEIVDDLNSYYEDVAIFTIKNIATGLIEITITGISHTITLEVDCTPIP